MGFGLSNLLFAAILSVVLSLCSFSKAVPSKWDGLNKQARDILARATPAAPHFVVYGDKYVSGTTGPPATSQITVSSTYMLNACTRQSVDSSR